MTCKIKTKYYKNVTIFMCQNMEQILKKLKKIFTTKINKNINFSTLMKLQIQ